MIRSMTWMAVFSRAGARAVVVRSVMMRCGVRNT
jgi:hypothetical protein